MHHVPRLTRRRGSARQDRDRGTALLEAAIILPVVLVVLAGVFELGFMYRSASVVVSSSRSGARLAAQTYGKAKTVADQDVALDRIRTTVEKDLSARDSSDTPVWMWLYKVDPDAGAGFDQPKGSTNFSSCATNCVRFDWNGTQFVRDTTSTWVTTDSCGRNIDQVAVAISVRHKQVVFGFLGTRDLVESTAMRLEPRDDCVTPE